MQQHSNETIYTINGKTHSSHDNNSSRCASQLAGMAIAMEDGIYHFQEIKKDRAAALALLN